MGHGKPTKRQLQAEVGRQVKRKVTEDDGNKIKVHNYNEDGYSMELIDDNTSEWIFPSVKQLDPLPINEDDEETAIGKLAENESEYLLQEEQTQVRNCSNKHRSRL
jgi:hypothetical protein